MGEYTLSHELVGEQQRLALMSSLLDPIERARFARLGVRPGWRCLELGCGNGSIAQALAEAVAPTGHVVASDIDLAYIADLRMPCLEVRRIDILQDVIEEGCYDFVVARALLHHLTPRPQGRGADDRRAEARRRASFHRAGHAALYGHRAGGDARVLARMA